MFKGESAGHPFRGNQYTEGVEIPHEELRNKVDADPLYGGDYAWALGNKLAADWNPSEETIKIMSEELNRPQTKETVVGGMTASWTGSSGGILAEQTISGVASRLGYAEAVQNEWWDERPEMKQDFYDLGELMYSKTQDHLKTLGVSHVRLYRSSLDPRGGAPGKLFSSWSTQPGMFITTDPGRKNFYADVPIEQVFSTYGTGFGNISEREVVLMGTVQGIRPLKDLNKGESEGHPFRGNQYVGGQHGAAKPIQAYWDKIKDLPTTYFDREKKRPYQDVGIYKEDSDYEILIGLEYLSRNIQAFPEQYQASTIEEYISQVEGKVQAELDKNQIFVRVTPENLEAILEDEEILNTFDNKKTSAPLKANKVSYKKYKEARLEGEEKLMGVGRDSEDRPIYGYLSKTENGRTLDAPFNLKNQDSDPSYQGADDPFLEAYGSVAIKLKPQTKSRATWSNIDSLDSSDRIRTSPLTNPSYFSMYENFHAEIITEYDTDSGLYWEAQVYGGVTLNDIEHIYARTQLPPGVTQLLDERGIPWTIVK